MPNNTAARVLAQPRPAAFSRAIHSHAPAAIMPPAAIGRVCCMAMLCAWLVA